MENMMNMWLYSSKPRPEGAHVYTAVFHNRWQLEMRTTNSYILLPLVGYLLVPLWFTSTLKEGNNNWFHNSLLQLYSYKNMKHYGTIDFMATH